MAKKCSDPKRCYHPMRFGFINPLEANNSDSGIYIVSADDSASVSVAYDTPFGSVTKPTTVHVYLSDDTEADLDVAWIEGDYTQDVANTYDVYGNLTLPVGVTNPFLVQGHIQITVQPEVFVETFTVTGFNTWTVPDGVTEVTSLEVIGAGATGGSVGQIDRAPGGGGGAYSEKEALAVTAGQLIPYYIPPEQLAPLPAGSNVDGLNGGIAYFGPPVAAGSTVLSGSGAPGAGTGSDGNYYSNILTGELYGPKAAGAWPGSPAAASVKAAGGSAGTGVSPGTGGQGGLASASIGDNKFDGGDGIAAPASRSGAGGAAASPAGAGANATTTGGTNSVGGVGVAPGGSGGNGSSGTPGVATDYGGGGAGARNTSVSNTRGGAGKQGWGRLTYSGATVPPVDPGDAYVFGVWGQSNVISPGNGSPGAPYTGVLNTKMWISSTIQFDPLEYGVNNNIGGSIGGLGPELSLATEVAAMAPDETFIVKKGQSGTSMYTHWNVANNSTGRSAVTQLIAALDYLDAQNKTIRQIHVMFRQGEADMGSSNPNGPDPANVKAEYKDKFQDLIKYTIDQLTSAGYDLTVIDFYFHVCLIDNTFGGSASTTYQTQIVEAQQETVTNFDSDFPAYASKYAGGFAISSAAYTTVDGIHFGTSSEIQMGLDFAANVTIP